MEDFLINFYPPVRLIAHTASTEIQSRWWALKTGIEQSSSPLCYKQKMHEPILPVRWYFIPSQTSFCPLQEQPAAPKDEK